MDIRHLQNHRAGGPTLTVYVIYYFTCMALETQSGALSSSFMTGFSSFEIVAAEMEDILHDNPSSILRNMDKHTGLRVVICK